LFNGRDVEGPRQRQVGRRTSVLLDARAADDVYDEAPSAYSYLKPTRFLNTVRGRCTWRKGRQINSCNDRFYFAPLTPLQLPAANRAATARRIIRVQRSATAPCSRAGHDEGCELGIPSRLASLFTILSPLRNAPRFAVAAAESSRMAGEGAKRRAGDNAVAITPRAPPPIRYRLIAVNIRRR